MRKDIPLEQRDKMYNTNVKLQEANQSDPHSVSTTRALKAKFRSYWEILWS